MRNKLLARNTVASLLTQVVTLICGFILPRFFLQHYGSEVNGLVSSISQFLSVISFLELGVGAVVQSALYKPLADRNREQVSKVMASANRFFRRLASILLAYVLFLLVVYPLMIEHSFGFLYTAALIAAISISSFAQYYFGIVNSLLLTADQRGYIQYNAQTITIILNTIICIVLIQAGGSIQLVKLASSLIYLIRPIVLRFYIDKRYQINWKIQYQEEPIQQKWNGVAQHVAAVVLDGTDTIVLTMFSNLSDVSIYSVYFLVVKGVKTVFLSLTNGIQSLMGELWAKQEIPELNELFDWTEWVIHTGATFVFGVTAVLIVPFVRVYTNGIHDANYIQPLFAALIVAANAVHCLRLPYNIMILAAGHYKQTQNNYIVAAVVNIVVSVLAVKAWGLIGVAIGTLLAMGYQTVWMALYDSKNLIRWPFAKFLKQIAVDVITVVVCCVASCAFTMTSVSYVNWVINAIEVAIVWLVFVIIINLIFFREKVQRVFSGLKANKQKINS